MAQGPGAYDSRVAPLLVLLVIGGDVLERRATDTLTAVEMDAGDTLRFTLASGETRALAVEAVDARVLLTNLPEPKKAFGGGGTVYVMSCRLRVDGHPLTIRRLAGPGRRGRGPLRTALAATDVYDARDGRTRRFLAGLLDRLRGSGRKAQVGLRRRGRYLAPGGGRRPDPAHDLLRTPPPGPA